MTKTTGRKPRSEPERRQFDERAERKAEPAEETSIEGAIQRGPRQPITSLSVFAAHLTWFFLGPMTLLLLLMGIVEAGTGWATVLDVVYFAILAAIVGARWFDQRSGQSTTSTGEPSTWEDFRRWAVVFPLVAVAAWIGANLIGNHIL
jgi:hypothetical protein